MTSTARAHGRKYSRVPSLFQDDRPLELLVPAGGYRCAICGGEFLRGFAEYVPPNSRPTRDHVFPKSPLPADLARIRRLQRVSGGGGRTAAAHASCNRRKGNRPPTGCEVVFLMSVNARLGTLQMPVSNAERNRREKARKKAAKLRKLLAQTAGILPPTRLHG